VVREGERSEGGVVLGSILSRVVLISAVRNHNIREQNPLPRVNADVRCHYIALTALLASSYQGIKPIIVVPLPQRHTLLPKNPICSCKMEV